MRPLALILLAVLTLLVGACSPIPQGSSAFTSELPPVAPDATKAPTQGSSAFTSELPPVAPDATKAPTQGSSAFTSELPPVAPDATKAPTPDTVLAYHMEGGVAGFCDDLAVSADGRAVATRCGSSDAANGQLTADEAAQLSAWRAELQSFAASTADRATADAMKTDLRFAGNGARPASDDEKLAIAAFAQRILLRLRQPVAVPPQTFTTGLAAVESVEVQVLDQSPLSVLVIARGNLPDGCTSIADTPWAQQGDTFEVAITTVRPEEMMCTQVLVPFEETVMIEPESTLPPGVYTVKVNGVAATLEVE